MKTLLYRNLLILIACLALVATASCENDDFCCDDPDHPLLDSWLLFERGYSPGSGYIIDPVPENPAQTMEFDTQGNFDSNINGLEEFRYFRILEDRDWEVLALFKSKPDGGELDPDQLEHSYNVEFQENGTLKLYFRYCIEGCHLGLRKTAN